MKLSAKDVAGLLGLSCGENICEVFPRNEVGILCRGVIHHARH